MKEGKFETDYFKSLDYAEKYRILEKVNPDSLIKVLIKYTELSDIDITSSSIDSQIRNHYGNK